MDLSTIVADWLRRNDLAGTTGIVAVSGGPDSVALAHACARLTADGFLQRIVLGHINHQLRGPASDEDEAFVHALPALLPTDSSRASVRSIREASAAAIHQSEDAGNIENAARTARYAWLAQLARDESAAWVATGHTADDQAETVLFRLLRGAGVLGLSAIPPRRPLATGISLVRPFLDVRRSAVQGYLAAHGLPFRVDASNQDRRFTRNRIRLDLLPRIEDEYSEAIVPILCRLAEQARGLHAEIEEEAARLLAVAELPKAGPMLVFAADKLQTASANRLREMFRLVWKREGWSCAAMDFARWNWLAEIAVGARGETDFPGRIHARLRGKVLQIEGQNR
jgi:tRNA(Ile)-lysidine synthase